MLAAVMLLSTACGFANNSDSSSPDASDTSESTSAELTKVRFLLDWTPNTNHTGIYAASSLGFYEEEGLEVEIIQPGESSALSLVAAGKADFCVTFQDVLAAALSADAPLPVTSVAAVIQHNTSGIISLADKNIVTPKDMPGNSYATWDTTIEKAIIRELVETDGGNYEEIEMIPNTVMDVVAALQVDIDMVWIFYAWDGIATELAGLETNFIDFGKTDPALDFYTPVIAASTDYLSENSDVAKRFLAATARGYEYSIENPEQAAEILLEAAPELDRDLVIASQSWLADQYRAEATQWGYIDIERWDNFFNWMYDQKLINRKLESGEGFTNDYLAP
jgi:ABC-type nitrate/sulfonate/bicarbonate transport system substrate-binding protein